MAEQNIKSLNDSLRLSKNRVGDLEGSKQVLITNKKDLESLNASLNSELEKEKGHVFNLTKIMGKLSNVPQGPIQIETM